MRDHPVIKDLRQKGYLVQPRKQAFDTLGNEIGKGDPILKLNGKLFSENNLTTREQIILSECGATESEA